jgi:glycosyltransferase involved in cell wall biosynthesis
MRILMLSDVYFPRINGVSTSIQTFRRQFATLGHEVLLIAPSYGPATEPEAGIVRLPARTVPFDPEDRMMGFKAALELEPALRERRFDLIHIQTPFVAHCAGVALSRRLGLPRVETYHTFFEEYLHHYIPAIPGRWTRALARRFSRAQCNDLDAVVVPSRAMLEVLREYGVHAPVEIIPTGIELERLTSGDGTAFRQRHGIPPERPVLVHVGRVAFEKNIDFLLRMLVRVRADVPEVLLVIAGEGPSSRHLQRLARHLGLERNVLFVGYLDRRNALLDCYCAGDAFVFASRTETQGLVLLEAMALGLPVVSTAVMGTRDILEPGRGALVPREDEAEFAARVVELLQDPALRLRLSREAHGYAAEWGAPRMAARMLELYARVLDAVAQQRLPTPARLGKTALL